MALKKFRKKQVIVQAKQWFPDREVEGVEPLDALDLRTEARLRHALPPGASLEHYGWIATLEGGHVVSPGDWIITGVENEKYPCKPSVFEATYEPVDEAPRSIDTTYDDEPYNELNDPARSNQTQQTVMRTFVGDAEMASRELDRVREVIREFVAGNPVVQPERVAEWLAVFLATSADFERERAERLRRLTVELAEARRYMPPARDEAVMQAVGVEVVEGGAFSEHDDG